MANIPQFLEFPVIARNASLLLTANTAKDGTGTIVFLQTNTGGTLVDLVAGTKGLWVDHLVIMPLGANVATVMRLFTNNGQVNSTALNNMLIDNITLPLAAASEVAAQQPTVFIVKKLFPSGIKFFITLGTTVVSGHSVVLFGGSL